MTDDEYPTGEKCKHPDALCGLCVEEDNCREKVKDHKKAEYIRLLLSKLSETIEEIETYDLEIKNVDGTYKSLKLPSEPATMKKKVTLNLVFYTKEFVNPKLRKD